MFLKAMNWIDFVIVGIIIFELIKGVLSGFSLELFNLVRWLIAAVIGFSFNTEFSIFLEPYFSDLSSKIASSFVILFLITLLVANSIRMLLGSYLTKPKLSFLNRIGGMFCRSIHGLLAILILVMLGGLTHLPESSWWNKSKLIPPFQIAAIWLKDRISSDQTKYIHY